MGSEALLPLICLNVSIYYIHIHALLHTCFAAYHACTVADSGERDSDPFTYLELGSKNKDELNINEIAVDN